MEIINRAVQELKKGKVIICPTDTVYGLVADATNKKAVEKIFKIKRRPKSKALPVFIKDLEMAKKIAGIDNNQEKFLKKAWPGMVTAVLRRKKNKINLYGLNKKTIALRIPNFKLVLDLLKKINRPLAETSANISGKSSSTDIKEVLEQFVFQSGSKQGRYYPDFVILAGNLPKRKPSTVIDLTKKSPKTLRH